MPNYFTPKWVNHSIYKGLRVVHNVPNMEREKITELFGSKISISIEFTIILRLS